MEMLSLERCAQILNGGKSKYTVEEVKRIRDILYNLAYLEKEIYLRESNEKRNNLHKSIN
jgi:hypothetical protein